MKILKNLLALIVLCSIWIFIIPHPHFLTGTTKLMVDICFIISSFIIIFIMYSILSDTGSFIKKMVRKIIKKRHDDGGEVPESMVIHPSKNDKLCIPDEWRKEAIENSDRTNKLLEELNNLSEGHYIVSDKIMVYQEIVDLKYTTRWILRGLDGPTLAFTKEFLDSHPEMFKWVENKKKYHGSKN